MARCFKPADSWKQTTAGFLHKCADIWIALQKSPVAVKKYEVDFVSFFIFRNLQRQRPQMLFLSCFVRKPHGLGEEGVWQKQQLKFVDE